MRRPVQEPLVSVDAALRPSPAHAPGPSQELDKLPRQRYGLAPSRRCARRCAMQEKKRQMCHFGGAELFPLAAHPLLDGFLANVSHAVRTSELRRLSKTRVLTWDH